MTDLNKPLTADEIAEYDRLTNDERQGLGDLYCVDGLWHRCSATLKERDARIAELRLLLTRTRSPHTLDANDPPPWPCVPDCLRCAIDKAIGDAQ